MDQKWSFPVVKGLKIPIFLDIVRNKEDEMFGMHQANPATIEQVKFLQKLDPEIAMLENLFKRSFWLY